VIIRKEHILRVFEKMMQRRIFWSKRNKIIGGWRRLPSEELHNLYFSLNNYSDQIKEGEMDRACCTHGEKMMGSQEKKVTVKN
jgi:hypothetical protein